MLPVLALTTGVAAATRTTPPPAPARALRPERLMDDLHLAALERRSELGVGRASRGAPVAPALAPPPRPARVRPADGAVTGVFGEHRGSHIHPGLDLDGETGDEVWSAADGTVVQAGPAALGWSGYGTVVLIDHGAGVQTLYAHLSAVTVTVGQAVPAGQLVGAIGTSGNVTGSHLHFEVRIEGRPSDPLAWLGDASPPTPAAPAAGWVPTRARLDFPAA